MDRLFLDANVLFSAAYLPNALLLRFWKITNVMLCSSRYALEEARGNFTEEIQKERLGQLAEALELFDATPGSLPEGVALPEKDAPILLAAIAAGATHLITGDFRHFGPYFGKRISGILILPPGDYPKRLT